LLLIGDPAHRSETFNVIMVMSSSAYGMSSDSVKGPVTR
jgi:hypothetical protein